jgi:hypothetical protein
MAKAKPQMITARQFAMAIERPYSTVTAWLAAGLVEGAEAVEVGTVKVWQVPVDAVKSFRPPKRGRPTKAVRAKKKLSITE